VLTPNEHDQLPFSDSLLRPCNDRKKAEFVQIAGPERDRALLCRAGFGEAHAYSF